MKHLSTMMLMLLAMFTILGLTSAFGQIYGPEGMNMPGAYNSWNQPPTDSVFAGIETATGKFLLSNSLPTPMYRTVIHAAPYAGADIVTPATYQFLFTSGPTSGYYNNKWANDSVVFNTLQTYTWQGASNDSVTFGATDTGYFFVNFQDNGYANTQAVWMKVRRLDSLTNLAGANPVAAYPNTAFDVAENFTPPGVNNTIDSLYVRWSSDGGSTWNLTQMGTRLGFGSPQYTMYAKLPGFPGGTTITYYIITTTARFSTGLTAANADLYAIRADNNSGSNYTATVASTPLSYTEDFNYTPGTTLISNGWNEHSGIGTNTQFVAYSGGLQYQNSGIYYANSFTGSSDSIRSSGEDVNHPFPGNGNVASGNVYAAFMANFSAVGTSTASSDYFFHLAAGPINTTFTGNRFSARVYTKKSATTGLYGFGLSANGETATFESVNSRSIGTTYLVVVKYVFNPAGLDSAYLFVNPLPGGNEGAPAITAAVTSANPSAPIAYACLRQGTSLGTAPSGRVDGINVGTTWASVVVAPTVTAPTVTTGAATSVTTTTATLNGTVNPNFGSTSVTFQYGTTIAYGSSQVAAQSPLPIGSSPVAVSAAITGLSPNQLYHFRDSATNSAGGNVGSDATFTTPPNVPTANAATSITATGFSANWTAGAGGADSYQLDVATDVGFSSFVPGFQNKSEAGLTDAVTGLTAGNTYYYRVRAVGVGGTTANSNTTTVLTLPPAPTTTAASGVSATSFTANWTASTSATSYLLDVATDVGFSSFVSGYNAKAEAGLSDAVTGLTANHTYYYRVRAVNGTGTSDNSNTTNVTTTCPTITITATPFDPLPNGQVGVSYNETLHGSGGTGPYTFAVTQGVTPAGLTLTGASGVVNGTPTTVQIDTFSVTATDADGCTGTQQYIVVVSNCPVLTFSPSVLRKGEINDPYADTVTATGGVGPYGYTLTSGTLPAGVTFSAGIIAGTPTVQGEFPIQVTVHDSGNGCEQFQNYTLIICGPIVLGNLSNGTVGTAYHDSITNVSGGTAPFTYAITTGSAPAGLTLAANGALAGIPTTAQIDTFTVTVTDAGGCQDNHQYILTMSCPTISVGTLEQAGTVGTAYSHTYNASGGTAPYAFTSSGTLPTGLTLSGAGVLSGLPTVAGSYPFSVTATDHYGCSVTVFDTVNMVCPAITVSPSTLPNLYDSIAFSQKFTSAGGNAPYAYSLTGSVPPGLVMSHDTLKGIPGVGGTYTFQVVSTDLYNCVGTQSFTIIVGSPAVFRVAAGGPNDTLDWNSPATWHLETGTSISGYPVKGDAVIMDNNYHTGSYTVTAGKTRTDSCATIQIGYASNPNTITLLIPSISTSQTNPAFYFGDGQNTNIDLDIEAGGLLLNGSLKTSANDIYTNGLGDSVAVRAGGRYLHTGNAYQSYLGTLTHVMDGNYGTVEFDAASAFTDINVQNYYFPNLVLTHHSGGVAQYYTYTLGSAGTFFIMGNLTVNNGVNDSLSDAGDGIEVYGNIVNNGTTKFTSSPLVLAGKTAKTITGTNPMTLGSGLISLDSAGTTVSVELDVTGGAVQTTGTYARDLGGAVYSNVNTGGVVTMNGTTMYLNPSGSLTEAANPIEGVVSATRTMSQNVAETFGGIGTGITALGGAPGVTTVVRTTGGVADTGNGNHGILRHYDITPANDVSLNAALNLYYVPSELNGLAESDLMLFKSTDNGQTWHGKTGTVNLVDHHVGVTGVPSLSRWTAGAKSFPLFITHNITVSNVTDADGNIFTTGDQTARKWRENLYAGYISDTTLVNTQNLTNGVMLTPGLDAGTYISTETDSAGWVRLGSIVNGVTKPGAGHFDTVSVSGGIPATITYVQQISSTLSALKFKDTDGNPATKGDWTAKKWHLSIYKDSVAVSTLIISGDTSMLTASNLQGGKYFIVEADSGSGWVHINGSHTHIDTITIAGGAAIFDSIANFQPNSIVVRKYNDVDGQFATSADRVLKSWHFVLHHDNVADSTIIGQASGDSVSFGNLGDGTYYVVEADSAGWTHIGSVVNGTPVAGNLNYAGVGVATGQTGRVDFVNAPPIYSTKFRTFHQNLIARDEDNKLKVGKLVVLKGTASAFSFQITAPKNIGVVVKWSQTSTGQVQKGPDSLASWTAAKSITLATIDSGAVLTFTGRGTSGKPITASYTWTTAPRKTVKGTVATFIYNYATLPMPNRINVLATAMTGMTNGFIIGQVRTDSVKNYGWLQSAKYGDIFKTLYDGKAYQVNAAHPFDYLTGTTKPVLKQNKTLTPTKFNDVLLGDLIALKLSIAASQAGITPRGLDVLTYDDGTGPGNVLNGKLLRDISSYGDSVMMGWLVDSSYVKNKKTVTVKVHKFAPASVFAHLDSVVNKIDSAFEGPIDTTHFADSLRLKGVNTLLSVPFLHSTGSAIPAVITVQPRVSPEVPLAYRLYQNYPNPFNPTTTIQFDLPMQSFVTITVYNILGQEVITLLNHEQFSDGTQTVQFNARNLASGVYFYRIVAQGIEDDGTLSNNTFQTVQKMMLIK